MISALLLRFGIPEWAAKFFGIIAIVASLAIAAHLYHSHVFNQGVAQESKRRDKIDADNAATAQKALMELNAKILVAQAQLDAARIDLEKLQQENESEKVASSIRESALRSGAERMRADFVNRSIAQAGSNTNGSASNVDNGATVTEDLSGDAAAGLESIRQNENNAIDRLNGCISSYDAMRQAYESIK